MAANYPTSDPSFTTKNTGDTIQAAHVNAAQDEIVAIGSALRGTLQHALTVGTGGLTVSSGGLAVSTGNVALGQNLSVAGNSTFTGSVVMSSLVTATAQPRCMAWSSVGLALPSGAWTSIGFESEDYDVGGLHSTATNPTRITVPVGSSGLFLVGATVRCTTGGAGNIIFSRFLKNSTTEVSGAATSVLSSVAGITLHPTAPIVLDGGDFLEVQAQPSGSTGSLSVANARISATDFWAVRIW